MPLPLESVVKPGGTVASVAKDDEHDTECRCLCHPQVVEERIARRASTIESGGAATLVRLTPDRQKEDTEIIYPNILTGEWHIYKYFVATYVSLCLMQDTYREIDTARNGLFLPAEFEEAFDDDIPRYFEDQLGDIWDGLITLYRHESSQAARATRFARV
ncbi:hypothetical protein MGYG_08751 [Nannizzia gypsea CBS 118893]|uniref:Uncharacterized protein n=1 Tax=Arthroderma gypseum (strain ATCC MYA-4604 / CBS 118893) TaxID=535722 RepID=E4V6W2_ARTGP|nr:hypothetical protein MGYG_08751 [Nannizzia gypsea CBS 118893]EFQ96828.1 hypothetical protein MGYG_08751 [Nannizzia gypsea CBS 118893]